MPDLSTTLRSLRNPNYRLFFGGQAASLTGMWLQLTAQSWLIYRLTGSAAAVGVVTFAMQGPGLFLGPLAGALADRYDKRRILVLAQASSTIPALLLGLVTLSGRVEPWHIILLAFLSGLTRAFEIPTRQSFIAELVERRDLSNAIALNSALFNGARLIGPAIAGVLIPTVGEAWCFLANAVSYAAIVGALIALRLPRFEPPPRADTSIAAEIGEALRYVRGQPAMLGLFGSLSVSAVAGMPYTVLLPSFASRMLGGGPETFSYLQIAVGLGSIVGALALASKAHVLGLERWVVGAGFFFGICLVAISLTRSVTFAVLALIPTGLFFMVQMATTNTLFQTLAPNALRGRIMSFHTSAFLGLFPIAGLLAGVLADRFGEAAVLAGGGVVVSAGAIVFGRVTLRHAPGALSAAVASSDSRPSS